MNAVAPFFTSSRSIGNARIVELAEKIRRPGINGFIAPNFLSEFDTLAQGKKFGARQYNGEAARLISAQGTEYYELYTTLRLMCDWVAQDAIDLAA